MIQINLLPFRAARKTENIRRQISLFFLSILLVGLILGAVFVNQANKARNLTRKVNEIQQKVDAKKKVAQKVDKLKKQLNILNQKTKVIAKLDKNRKDPLILLDTMSGLVIPNRMWFESLVARGNTVVIKGKALDNKTTADFMKSVERSPLFSSVSLKVVKGKKLKSFEVTCKKAGKKTAAKGKAKK